MGDEVPGSWLFAGFPAGSRIAGYRIEEQIGSGGMAVVFRALDERLGRQVALKVLAPALSADEAFRQRFIRESQLAAAVDDPHIIPVFEAGDADGVLFIAMRYVPGGDAGTLVRRLGPLPPVRAAAIVSAVASALDAAHAAGLVHRDVKPGNMLVDARPGRADHVYLADFGLTKGLLSSASLTGTGHFVGTLDYCAPEQIQGQQADARTDEYALACAAFTLLAGEPPFPRDGSTAVMYAQLWTPPPLLAARRPDLPPAVDEVLQRALAKAPEARYDSCGRFAAALRVALGLREDNSDRGAGPGPDHPLTEVVRTGDPDERFGLTADAVPRQAPAGTPDITAGSAGTSLPAAGARPHGRIASRQERPTTDRKGRGPSIVTLAGAAILAAGGIIAAVILASAIGHRPSGTTNLGAETLSPSSASARSANPGPSGSSHLDIGRASSPDAASNTIVRTFPDPGTGIRHVNSIAFSPDGTTLATGDSNGNAYLWSADTGRQIAVLGGSGAKVFAVAFSPDGAIVAAGFGDGSTSLWNAVTGQLIDTIADPGGKAVNSVAFSQNGKTLATGDANGSAYLWDFTSGGHAITLAHTLADPTGAGIWALTFSPDGKMLAVGDYKGSTYLWTAAATGSPAATYTVPGGLDVTAVAFSPDGKTLATGNLDGTAYLWNLANGTHTIINEPGTVWTVAFNRSGTLAIGDKDGSTYLWDTATGDQTAVLTDPASGAKGVGAVAFSPDGMTLATGDTNGTTYLWKIG
jgi:serine/threonine protein kinase